MKLLVAMLVSCSLLSAGGRDSEYQEAILVDFTTVTTDSSCSGTTNTNGGIDGSGNVFGRTYSNTTCGDVTSRRYTLIVGQRAYVIRPARSAKQIATAAATLGYSRFFEKNS